MLTFRKLLVLLAVLSAALWWLLRDNAEAQIQHAHEEIVRLVNIIGPESGTAGLLGARALQSLFAPTIALTGDAETPDGTYTPEQLVALIFQARALFDSIDLTISEPAIEFSADDEAVTRFSAVLRGSGTVEGHEQLAETRSVVSLMHEIDGEWLFSEFRLSEPTGN